jgi:hypothetical protein
MVLQIAETVGWIVVGTAGFYISYRIIRSTRKG